MKNYQSIKSYSLNFKLKFLLNKIYRLASILVNMIILENVRSVLLTMRFFEVSIVNLFSFLYFYFQGSKYKDRIKHFDLLPLMAV